MPRLAAGAGFGSGSGSAVSASASSCWSSDCRFVSGGHGGRQRRGGVATEMPPYPLTSAKLGSSRPVRLLLEQCVGGHEILPVGGQGTARWWPRELPTGGQQNCPRC